MQIFKKIISKPLDLSSKPWPQISEAAKSCVRGMLARDPRKRLTAEQLLRHEVLEEAGMLARDPRKRPTAEQLLRHEWMRGAALGGMWRVLEDAGMLARDPRKRLTAEQPLRHEWMRGAALGAMWRVWEDAGMLARDPRKRPTAEQLPRHEWIRGAAQGACVFVDGWVGEDAVEVQSGWPPDCSSAVPVSLYVLQSRASPSEGRVTPDGWMSRWMQGRREG
eukprot:364228-Chlamydomonas_euryale.AAC.15